MEEIQQLCVKRCGFKGSVTKLLAKVDEALTAELETVNVESTSEARRVLVVTTVKQLRMKHEQIGELDNSIAERIQKEEELESEICDADTYQTTLEQQIAMLTEFMKKADQPPVVAHPTHPPTVHEKHLTSIDSSSTCYHPSINQDNGTLLTKT